MKNIPKEIYLQISELTDNFKDHEVSWCEDRVNDSDIKYVLDASDKNAVLERIIESDCVEACKTVVESYEGDGMENMNNRDQVMYDACKKALANHSLLRLV